MAGVGLDEHFASLDRHVKASAFKQVVKVSDQILGLAPGDPEATECKVVALIQLDDFQQALSFIESVRNPAVSLSFQKAYCLYKRNQLVEALAALRSSERTPNVLQLEAQILFKTGDLDSCISSYEKLFQKHKVDSDEVKSNVLAAYISGGRSNEVPALMDSLKISPRNNFNLAYNAACALTERGEFANAEEHLLLARRIGQEMLIEEEFHDDEIEDELAPISVQLAYVQQCQGRITEAIEGYNTLLKRKPSDLSSVAVASNNLIALRGARELFDSLKKFDKLIEKKGGQKAQFVDGLEHKLSASQKEAISFNRFLLLLYSNKLDQARELVQWLMDSFPNSVVPTLLSSSLLVKEGKSNRAEDILGQYANKHPINSTTALLVRAQVAASTGNFARAAESLEQITDHQYKLGMVATLVALRERSGDVKGAESVLDAAVEWWGNHMEDDTPTLELLIYVAASFKLKHNKLTEAAELFQRLLKSSSSVVRTEALNGLVSSTAYLDPVQAEFYEAQLPPLPGLTGVDVEVLERSAPTTGFRRGRTTEEGLNKLGDERPEKVKSKKKRKRKPLYPKGFDPAKPGPPPDPERWLPKRERSSFRPRKKDKRTVQIRGAQGSTSRVDSVVANVGTKSGASSVVHSSKPATAPANSDAQKVPLSSQRTKKKGRR